jgi:hypothetical protein
MRTAILCGVALALVFTASGCGDSIDAAAKEEIKLLERKAAVLDKIKDKESAQEARAELEEINQKEKELTERMKKLTKDQKPEKVLEIRLKYEEAETKVKSRLRQARTKALEHKDAAAALKGIDLD